MKRIRLLLLVPFLWGCHHTSQERLAAKSKVLPVANVPATVPPPKPVSRITEMTLEREPGGGGSLEPEYALTLRQDGTAMYIGYINTDGWGTYRTTFSPKVFDKLAQSMEACHFEDLCPMFGPGGMTHMPWIGVSVVKDNIRSTILDFGEPVQSYEKETPPALKQIQKDIDDAVAKSTWILVKKEGELPRYLPSKDQIDKLKYQK